MLRGTGNPAPKLPPEASERRASPETEGGPIAAAWSGRVEQSAQVWQNATRLAITATITAALLLIGPAGAAVWAAVGVAWLLTAAGFVLLSRAPRLAARLQPIATLVDLALLLVLVALSGSWASPLRPMLFAVVAEAGLWLSPRLGAGACLAAAGTCVMVLGSGPGPLVFAIWLALMGVLLSGWNATQFWQHRPGVRDALTGCFSRQYARFSLAHMLETDELEPAIVVIDIDSFQDVNQQQGHGVADTVLAGVGRILAGHVRIGDLVARYGDDEFLVALPGGDLETAAVVAERLRAAVQHSVFGMRAETNPVRVTVSCGVAAGHVNEGVDALLRRADQALDEAKAGRNRVVACERAIAAL